MTKKEVFNLLIMVDSTYPNFKIEDETATLKAWHFLLEDFNAHDIDIAFKTFVATDGSGFPPSVSQLIAMSRKAEDLTEMSASEAWSIVRKAIGRGNYHSQEDFDRFPEEIKRAVGSASQLKIWASDEDFNEGVESSNFFRRFASEQKREKEIQHLPKEARAQLQNLQRIALETRQNED